ncbi:hypothetical protein V6Z12_A12G056700 [Gossypium hirsutum]
MDKKHPLPLSCQLLINCWTQPIRLHSIDTDRGAIVVLREGLTDPSGRLSSWIGEDCCTWEGIKCHNQTGRVTKLDLRNPYHLIGAVDPPAYKRSCLGDAYSNTGPRELRSQSLEWLTPLSSLKYLNLGFVKLDSTGDHWLQTFNMLPSLVHLRLHWCELKELYLTWDFFSGSIPDEFANLKNLQVLDLSDNLNLEGQIPGLLGNLSKLQFLDLSANNFHGDVYGLFSGFSSNPNSKLESLDLSSNSLTGELPESLGLLKHLQHLDLSSNSFWGSIPSSIGSLSALRVLDLSYNTMNGTIPERLGQLSGLVDMNLMANSWKGILKETHFMNLRKLQHVRLTTEPTRSLAFSASHGWFPPFKLKSIQLENCMTGPSFPVWLQVQNELTSVVLKNVSISDTIPGKWFSQLSAQLTYLVLSQDQMRGELPRHLNYPYLNLIDLSYNNFEGPFPSWSTNATDVILDENSFSGPIPENIGALMPRLQKLYVSRNHLTGRIPSSMCDIEGLNIISLRNNKLSGELPNCWHRLMLWGIDISNNSLTGNIPNSFGFLPSLSVLLLSNNNLDGEIPSSLRNCTGLTSMDLGGNKISGSLPLWLQYMSSLFMLRLGSNLLSGGIPDQVCRLQNLHILDLSQNKISGPIPKCFGNLSALVHGKGSEVFQRLIREVTRGRDPEYSNVVANVNSIELSGNNLTGEIPYEITNLLALRILDLSHNHLSGAIPRSLTSLASLTRLNLSYNHLSGSIPFLPRFNDSSIYEGNPLLCGAPLPTKCPLPRPRK